MSGLYFAYGSNLCLPRLRHRVPGVRQVGAAFLEGHALRWHKRGSDGSGKCSIEPVGDESPNGGGVHGALFDVPEDERPGLDRVEGLGIGYREARLEVAGPDGNRAAWTYVANAGHVEEGLRPFGWYHDLVLEGAAALGLPGRYLDHIRRIETLADPDRARAAWNLRFLECR